MEHETSYFLKKQIETFKAENFSNCKNRRGIRKKSGDLLEDFYCQLVTSYNIPVSIEIGAHEGTFSKNIKKMKPSTECYAFEANPYVYSKYQARLKEVGIDYRNIAISNSDNQINLEIPVSRRSNPLVKDNPIASIHKRDQPGFQYESVKVTSAKFNSLFKNNTKRKAIWVDVEGAQYEVLKSIGDLWPSIDFIYIEIESSNVWLSNFNKQDIYEILETKGFSEIMRDNLASGQYNTVFAKLDKVNNDLLINTINDYTQELEALV